MEDNYENTIEVNNELKLNVDEQEDDLKHLKEQYDKDEEDKIQEIIASRTYRERIGQWVWHVMKHLQ